MATFFADFSSIEFDNNSIASDVANPPNLNSSKSVNFPIGLGALTATRRPVEVSAQAERSDLTPLRCRGCISCSSSIINAVFVPQAAEAIA